jgi:dihydrofolate reductase
VSALQERGLVDEYALFVHPSALGAGVPFFRRRVEMSLIDVRRFEGGALGLRYASAAAKAAGPDRPDVGL